jgi:hypothetical protein
MITKTGLAADQWLARLALDCNYWLYIRILKGI